MGLIHRLSARNKDSQIEYSDDGITNISDDIPKETTIVDEDEIVAEGIELTHDSVDENNEGFSPLENSLTMIYSWDYIPNVLAAKHVDKSALKYRGSALPESLFPFFHAENILPGKSKTLFLRYYGKEYKLNITRGKTNPNYTFENVRIFWDKLFGIILRDYCAENNNKDVKIVFKPGLDEIHYDVSLEVKTEALIDDLSENDNSEYGNVSDGDENVVEESENIYENMPIEDDSEEHAEEDEDSKNLNSDPDWKEDTPENARLVSKVLRDNFKVLGMGNEEAKIYSALIVYGPQTFFSLFQKYGAYRERLQDSLIKCCKCNDIVEYTVITASKRNVKTYKLNLSLQKIYDDLYSKNQELLASLTDTLKEIDVDIIALSKSDYTTKKGKFKRNATYSTLESEIIKLGLTKEVAQLLIFLELFSRTPIKDIESQLSIDLHTTSSAQIIRQLCYCNWIREDYAKNKLNREYSLREPLYDILLGYVINHADDIERTLNETKEIFDYIDNNPEVYKSVSISDNVNNDAYVVQKSPYDDFIENTTEIAEHYDLSADGSYLFYMKHPLPHKIRVYLYYVSPSNKREGYSKIVIRSKSEQKSLIDFIDSDFVIVAGYDPKFKVFILWNAHLHKDSSKKKELYVENPLIYSARINGIAESTIDSKVKNKPNGYIIAVSPENIEKAIQKQYDNYVDDLIKGKV